MVNSYLIMKWYFAVFLLLQSFSAFHVNGYGEHDFVLQTTADGLIIGPRYISDEDINAILTSKNELLPKDDLLHRQLCTAAEVQYYRDYVEVDLIQARNIFRQTIFQENSRWKMERQIRITASTAYILYTYATNTKFNKTKLDWQRKVGSVSLRDVPTSLQIQFGRDHEPIALSILAEKVKREGATLRTRNGLMINVNLPWLAYSPDGLIKKKDKIQLVEVKCPFVGQIESGNKFLDMVEFLQNNSGIYEMKKKHRNYAQIQLGMLLCNVKSTRLILYCHKTASIFEIEVPFDYAYTKRLISTLRGIFYEHFLPFLNQYRDRLNKSRNLTNVDYQWYNGTSRVNVVTLPWENERWLKQPDQRFPPRT